MIAAAAAGRAAPRVGEAFRRAASDFYEESWRLVLLNTALSAYVLVVLALAALFRSRSCCSSARARSPRRSSRRR